MQSHYFVQRKLSLFQYSGNHHSNVICMRERITLTCLSPEPVGRVPPKFPTMDNVRGFDAFINASITLLCPAQAFPVPLFR